METTAENLAQASAAVEVKRGRVLRYFEYTEQQEPLPFVSPLVYHGPVTRVLFEITIPDGKYSSLIQVDQALDPVSALIFEGDEVFVTISSDDHCESTVAPVEKWAAPITPTHKYIEELLDQKKPFSRMGFYNDRGCDMMSILYRREPDDPVVIVIKPRAGQEKFLVPAPRGSSPTKLGGVIIDTRKYTRFRHVGEHLKLSARIIFTVRVEDEIGVEEMSIDQAETYTSTLLAVGDQVMVSISNDVHVESTVHPYHPWASSDDIPTDVLTMASVRRTSDFTTSAGVFAHAQLLSVPGVGYILHRAM
jgi:hypothetical protein